MRRRRRAESAIVLVVCGGFLPVASASGAIELSLEQALERAEDRSPWVRLARKQRSAVEASRVGAALALPSNPVLGVGVGRRGDSSPSLPAARGVEWGLRLEQGVEVGGQRSARMSEAERFVELASARERLARVETRARVRAAYVALLLARDYERYARERVELGVRVLESAHARVDAGAAGDVELHLAQAEHGRLEHERLEAELAAAEGAGVLAWMLDLPEGSELALTTELAQPASAPATLEALQRAAHERREELRALRATRSALDAAIVRLQREAIPNPSVFLEFARAQPGQTYLGAGVGMALPLFRRHQGEIALAHAAIDGAHEEQRVVARQVESEVARAHRALMARRAELALWNGAIVPAADQNVELVTAGWHAGKFDFFRVVQALREAGDAHRRQLETLASLWQVAIELDRAAGQP